MSGRAGRNPFALARRTRIRARAKLLKAELKARHGAAPDEYLRGDVVAPASTIQVSDPGLLNDILDRVAQPKALPLDELDKAAQQIRELFHQYGMSAGRVLEEDRRELEDSRRKIEGTIAMRSKGGKNSGVTRAQNAAALDAAVSKILPTLSGSHRKQPHSAGAIQAIRDKLPANLKKRYKSDSPINKSVGRIRSVRARASTKVSN